MKNDSYFYKMCNHVYNMILENMFCDQVLYNGDCFLSKVEVPDINKVSTLILLHYDEKSLRVTRISPKFKYYAMELFITDNMSTSRISLLVDTVLSNLQISNNMYSRTLTLKKGRYLTNAGSKQLDLNSKVPCFESGWYKYLVISEDILYSTPDFVLVTVRDWKARESGVDLLLGAHPRVTLLDDYMEVHKYGSI